VPTVRIEEDPQRAIESVLACAAEDDAVLVAGSLFLVGAVRSVLCEGAREWKEDGADARAAP
jgi:folylpolyglutamate synthase/dihydropteroate synthase